MPCRTRQIFVQTRTGGVYRTALASDQVGGRKKARLAVF